MRNYLLKGGFLWVDDFWGSRAWNVWEEQIAKALPPGQYPIVDLPLSHELFHMLYDVREIPQIPSINFWFGSRRRHVRTGQPTARSLTCGRSSTSVVA